MNDRNNKTKRENKMKPKVNRVENTLMTRKKHYVALRRLLYKGMPELEIAETAG